MAEHGQIHFTAASALDSQIQEKVAGVTEPAVDEIVALGRHCGSHPENRAGTGVDPFNAQNLAFKICFQGYSESKLENPMGFEKAASGAAASAQSDFMTRSFDMPSGYLGTNSFPRCGIPPGNR